MFPRRKPPPRRTLQLIVDGMHPAVVRREIAQGRLPNLEFLVRNGFARWDCVSVFPTSTPVAVTSITTGEPPRRHGIPGMYWYDRLHDSPVYYGDNLSIIQSTFDSFFENVVSHLNHRHLRNEVRTVFEHLEHSGVNAASLNNMCFRGSHRHPATLPLFIRVLPGVRFTTHAVYGPPVMRWGDFARSGNHGARVFGEDGPFRQFGISDECTMRAFFELVDTESLPEFLLLYFPDNDVYSHVHGPQASGVHLRKWDLNLGRIFDALGGRDKAIAENLFFVIADHAQTPVGFQPRSVINLDQVLDGFSQGRLGSAWDEEDVFACPNGRFAQIYLRKREPRLWSGVLRRLLEDDRISHVYYGDGAAVEVRASGGRALRFEPGYRARDRWGNGWAWKGDLSLLDGAVAGLRLHFGRYPDAFSRLRDGVLSPAAGDFVLTPRAGFEFSGNSEEAHLGGGSHGGLSVEESEVPFLACGPGVGPRSVGGRITDLVPITLRHLGLKALKAA